MNRISKIITTARRRAQTSAFPIRPTQSHTLVVSYEGTPCNNIDREIKKVVGRTEDGCGTFLSKNPIRDLSWTYKRENSAKAAADRLKKSRLGRKLKVELNSNED